MSRIPEFQFGDKVKVVTGSRAGQTGWVVSYPMGQGDHGYDVTFQGDPKGLPQSEIFIRYGYMEWELERQ